MTTSIKHPVLTDHFFETLTKYHNDHMVHREAVTVRDRVLKRTGRNTITGMPNIIVRQARGLESDKKPFEAIAKGNSIVCMAVSPDKAFAHAAAEFWRV